MIMMRSLKSPDFPIKDVVQTSFIMCNRKKNLCSKITCTLHISYFFYIFLYSFIIVRWNSYFADHVKKNRNNINVQHYCILIKCIVVIIILHLICYAIVFI